MKTLPISLPHSRSLLATLAVCFLFISCSPRPAETLKFDGVGEGDELQQFEKPAKDYQPYKMLEGRPFKGAEQARLMATLVYYGIPCRYEDGQIYIRPDQLSDMELLWNYTTKAEDEPWFRQHLCKKQEYM